MSDMSVNQLLAQMRVMQAQVQAGTGPAPGANDAKPSDFSSLLKTSVEHVNGLQRDARHSAEAMERGDPGVDLAAVMVAKEKANLSFEAVRQVRNRLVRAYQEVLNMPI